MNASLELLHELGPSRVEAHVASLADEIVRWVAARKGMRLVTPSAPERRAGIVAVCPPNAPQISAKLKAAGVVHTLREGAIRLSPHCYNTREEVLFALDVIERGV